MSCADGGTLRRAYERLNRMTDDKSLRQHLVALLKGGSAHATFDAAVKDFPAKHYGKRPKGAAHSPWEVLEHLRIAQRDILEFSRNAKHVSPKFPDGYWPKTPAPADATAWIKSVQSLRADLKAMVALAENESVDLLARSAGAGRPQCLSSGRAVAAAAIAGGVEVKFPRLGKLSATTRKIQTKILRLGFPAPESTRGSPPSLRMTAYLFLAGKVRHRPKPRHRRSILFSRWARCA